LIQKKTLPSWLLLLKESNGEETGMKLAVCMNSTLVAQDISVENIRQHFFHKETEFRHVAEADSIAALHFAFSLCEKKDTVTAVSYGGSENDAALEYALAYGVKSLIRIEDEHPPVSLADPTVTAKALASWIRDESFDIVICGDPSGTGVIPALIAGYLGVPFISRVYAGKRRKRGKGETLELEQRLERGWRQQVSIKIPALVTVQAGFFSPMYVSVKRRRLAEEKAGALIQVIHLDKAEQEKAALKSVDAPKPRAKRKAMPDAKQSAANRLQSLMGGGGGDPGQRAGKSKKKDEDEKVRELAPEKAAQEIIDFLKKKELLPESPEK
jgi:electron transfer flavoprotein alpha/beta subunit